MIIKRTIFLIILSFCFGLAGAQENNNLRQRSVLVTGDTLKLDSLLILPSSLTVFKDQQLLDSTSYMLDPVKATLIILDKSLINDSLQVVYRVLPFDLLKTYKHKDPVKLIGIKQTSYNPFSTGDERPPAELFKFEGLAKSGSISRGITVGNNQDVVVNSSLNLQLSGKLNDDVEVLAVISDENIPIQPEGNTQQLQDFDRVFIQLSKDEHKLIAGDYDLKSPDGYFMNFFKRAQGLSFQTKNFIGEPINESVLKNSASVSFSKGKYAKNTFVGSEGNQGPYRLTGNNNETYLIVLAGSENVFLDGQLMARGQERDYIIDYNTAEIIFTPARLITKDSRISAEFQYSDKNYSRSLLFSGNEWSNKKFKLRINAFSEQDNKNQPALQDLDDDRKQILKDIGDDLSQAFVPNIDSIGFNTDQILYAKRDTLIAGIQYTYFAYSTSPDSAFFRVGFSSVGLNKGNYRISSSAANGRVYQWVPPLNGIPQASYEPVSRLIAPAKQEMLTVGVNTDPWMNASLNLEYAVSNKDLNLFSQANSADDVGQALNIVLKEQRFISAKDSSWKLNSAVGAEFASSYFNPIERYRSVEFDRDWNYRAIAGSKSNELLGKAAVGISHPKFGRSTYEVRTFNREGDYSGLINSLTADHRLGKYIFGVQASLLNAEDTAFKSDFIRHRLDVKRILGKWIVAVGEESERNSLTQLANDSLSPTGFYFQALKASLGLADTVANWVKWDYVYRTDSKPISGSFEEVTRAHNAGMQISLSRNPRSRLFTNTNYRILEVLDTTRISEIDSKTLVNRIEYNLSILKGGLTSSSFYEISTGQEQKKEFTYVEVSQGKGVYTWTDYNGNGVKELNEFEIAVFQDQANYVRVFTPTNTYLRTLVNQFNEALNFNPAAFMKLKSNGKKHFLTRLATQSAVRLEKKTLGKDLALALNPFSQNISDSLLLTTTSNIRNTLYFNRSAQKFGMDLSHTMNKSKTILSNGSEYRELNSLTLNTRWNINSVINLNTIMEDGEKSNVSEFFSVRNYVIHYNNLEPVLSFQPGRTFRASLGYRLGIKQNEEALGAEKAEIHKFSLELKRSSPKSGNINARFGLLRISFPHSENSPVAYEMLEGFRPGYNLTWGAGMQRALGSGLQLNLNYDGRKSVDSKSVHTGNVQVRAYF